MKQITPVHVLVVEDNRGDVELLKSQLDSLSTEFRVAQCSSIADAHAFLDKHQPDVILLDLSLPDSSGLDTLQNLQRQVDNISIVVLSGLSDEATAVEAVRSGAQDYIVKGSVDGDALGRIIRYAMERNQLMAKLQQSNFRYELAAKGANDGLWDWDLTTNEVFYSERWASILGEEKAAIGQRPEEWFDRVFPMDLPHLRIAIDVHVKGSTSHLECEYRMRYRDGTYRWMLCRGLAVRDAQGVAARVVGSQTDITQIKMAEAHLVQDANRDSLTRLHNREFFLNRVGRLLESAKRHEPYVFAVLFLDLDGFKLVNDSVGHTAGDRMLVTIAKRLEQCIRPADVIARMGGDEFTVLVDDISEPSDAIRIADRIMQRLAEPLELDGNEFVIGGSMGIALSSIGYDRPEDMLRDADIAMYQAKDAGKGQYRIFDHHMHRQVVDRMQLENDFRKALTNPDDFTLFFQPIVSCTSGRITGVEALARWIHPTRGLLSPSCFISMAEETGLIVPFGRWVMHESCNLARSMCQDLPPEQRPAINVNISCKQIARDLLQCIQQILSDNSRCAGELVLNLELTESVLLDHASNATRLLRQIRDLGVHLCIDDFGTGYSSLQYLRNSPFEILKIDRRFVNDMLPNGDNSEIVRTIISLGQNLGLATVAEGVETRDQLRQLQAMGCDYAQGYLFAQPVDAETIKELLTNQRGLDFSRPALVRAHD